MRAGLKRKLIVLAEVGLATVAIVALAGTVLPVVATKLVPTTQPASPASAPVKR